MLNLNRCILQGAEALPDGVRRSSTSNLNYKRLSGPVFQCVCLLDILSLLSCVFLYAVEYISAQHHSVSRHSSQGHTHTLY